MKPVFGGSGVSGSIAQRINAMRARSGLPEIDPDKMDSEAITAQKASDRGVGPYSDAVTIQYAEEDEPNHSEDFIFETSYDDLSGMGESDLAQPKPAPAPQNIGTPAPKGLMLDHLPDFATKGWYLGNFLAPLPYFLYTAYKFNSRSASIANCKGDPGVVPSEQSCKDALKALDYEHAYDTPYHGSIKDVFGVYRKHALWALIWSGTGGALTAFHAYRRGNGAKSIAMHGAIGASFPLVGIGLSLMQGFPLYNKPGQSTRSK